MSEYPVSTTELDLHPVEDGFTIYDPEKDKVHYLNTTAAVILMLCNGKQSTTEIAELLRRQFGLNETPTKDVEGVLMQFVDEGLVRMTRAK